MRSKKRARGYKARRSGKPYQQVVRGIVEALSPTASVKEGQWIEGPDGRRDLDVEIRGKVHGKPVFIFLDCKDWGKRVGIKEVDALHSKRADLGADFAALCSNSGFSADALRKAMRVNIGMFSAVEHGNELINMTTYYSMYQINISISQKRLSLTFVDQAGRGTPNYSYEEIYCLGKPFANWLENQLSVNVLKNAEFGTIDLECRFKRPIGFRLGNEDVDVMGIRASADFSSQWFWKMAKVDVSKGLFDHIRNMLSLSGYIQFPVVIGGNMEKQGWKEVDKQEHKEIVKQGLSGGITGVWFVASEICGVHTVGDGQVPELGKEIEWSRATAR